VNRRRLRPAYGADELARLYAAPHDHRRWRDHHLRVNATIQVANWLCEYGVQTAADLSCGNGAVLSAIPARQRYLGDFAPGHELAGPIEDTIEQIPPVDLFVCSETIEHLDDPDVVLKAVRSKSDHLVLSTPVDAWDDDNPEHYWAWSRDGVEDMLTAAGFQVVVYTAVDFRPSGLPYEFGIWGCR
jgi:hypothetical protein